MTNVVPVENIDKVDLLFVIDNSISMREEQQLLQRELPALIRTLTTGERRDGSTFAAVKDLHLGIVSTDMGTPGVTTFFDHCDAMGDQGMLLTRPAPDAACTGLGTGGPPFLSFRAGVDDAERITADFQCMAMLGTEGCGLEQQLESLLRAVTPSTNADLRFWGPSGMNEPGQADLVNAGFLRPADTEPSIVAVILVTDEEDCSSADTSHFDYNFSATPNLRCFENKDHLHAIQRYVDGLRALRPGQEHLVLFSAIAGVPVELVTDEALAQLDPKRPETFTAHFDRILAHPSMTEVPIIPSDPTEISKANLRTACENENGKAYPARRIVELARAFGPNGLVRSICEASFDGAIDSIVDAIVRQLPDVCLPIELVPNSQGLIEDCAVVWELPALPRPGSITSCAELPYLKPPSEGPARTGEGRARCQVDQVPVRAGTLAAGVSGWYYDDFSDEAAACAQANQRIAFTAPPPNGIRVTLECAREAPTDVRLTPDALDTVPQPQPGTDCRDANGAADVTLCRVQLTDGSFDTQMTCHPSLNVCIIPCTSNNDCPPAWTCDERTETVEQSGGTALCVNPTCGP